jgi:16S rRNA (guanine527-N7)-methyltransferase
LFPKGREAGEELAEARKRWSFDVVLHASITDVDARILEIKNPVLRKGPAQNGEMQ